MSSLFPAPGGTRTVASGLSFLGHDGAWPSHPWPRSRPGPRGQARLQGRAPSRPDSQLSPPGGTRSIASAFPIPSPWRSAPSLWLPDFQRQCRHGVTLGQTWNSIFKQSQQRLRNKKNCPASRGYVNSVTTNPLRPSKLLRRLTASGALIDTYLRPKQPHQFAPCSPTDKDADPAARERRPDPGEKPQGAQAVRRWLAGTRTYTPPGKSSSVMLRPTTLTGTNSLVRAGGRSRGHERWAPSFGASSRRWDARPHAVHCRRSCHLHMRRVRGEARRCCTFCCSR